MSSLVSHFLGDVAGDFLDVIVRLEVRTTDVERDIRAVDDAVQQRQVFRDDVLHFVGDVDLVAVELDLIAVHVEVRLDLREIQDTREVERIVHIEVDMEEGFVELHRIEFVVEGLVIFFGQVRGFAGPCRVDIVDDILFVKFDFLAVFPLFLFAKGNLDRQELTVFLEQSFDRCVLQVLTELIVDMQHDVGSALGFDGLFHRVLRISRARPVNGFRVLFVGLREDLHFLADHEGGVEAETEMADDGFGLVLVLVEELLGAGESDLVDELIHLFGRHADAMVGDGEGFLGFVDDDADTQVAEVTLGFADRGERLQFGRCIDGVRDQFAQEDLMVRIQKFLNDGEDVIACYPNISFTHMIVFLVYRIILSILIILSTPIFHGQNLCQGRKTAILAVKARKKEPRGLLC